MKKGAVLTGLFVLFGIVGLIFWYSEFVYSLPTPVPPHYRNISKGEVIRIDSSLMKSGKPLLLHFFNPDCPCSRFNVPHMRSLMKKYGSEVNFAVVFMGDPETYNAQSIREKFDADIPVLTDTSLATKCGVYSTPQAVILQPGGELYYRGNYNKTRYCTDPKTEYAALALEALLQRNKYPDFNQFALKAYGCELPACKKTSSN